MVQDPDTAKYDGMPKSAIETGVVDFVVPVEKMPETLTRYVKHPLLALTDKSKLSESPDKSQIQKIFALLRSATGHDFSHYKPNTTLRRLQRRLAVHQIKTLTSYIHFLQKNPDEIAMLFKNLVIGVTSFFRDPEAYDILAQKVLPDLLARKEADTTIRLWVAGCSTGEEAYSLGILICDGSGQKTFQRSNLCHRYRCSRTGCCPQGDLSGEHRPGRFPRALEEVFHQRADWLQDQ